VTAPNSQEDQLQGQVHAEGCALIELDNDGITGSSSYILKICGLGNCSFEGYNDSDNISRQLGIISCHKANNGLRDSEFCDEFSADTMPFC
jgi:hypothetical protein